MDHGTTMMNISELILLLRNAKDAAEVDNQREEIATLIPKVRIMFDYNQRNRAHQYDLWMHCVHAALGLPKDIEDDMLYLGALLHDIGKPDCQTNGKRPGDLEKHYYGHPVRSMEIVRDEIIPDLLQKGEMLSEQEQRRLIYYVAHHDDRMGLDIKYLKEHLALGVSLEEFQNLMRLEVADALAHVQIPIVAQRAKNCEILAGEYSRRQYEILTQSEKSPTSKR